MTIGLLVEPVTKLVAQIRFELDDEIRAVAKSICQLMAAVSTKRT
jgi:phosphotransferase system HPr-like phosphotransfer protein